MLIKFKKPDPRAGMTVRMDSILGQQFVDAGNADKVEENAPEQESAQAAAPAPAPAPEPEPEPEPEPPATVPSKAKK